MAKLRLQVEALCRQKEPVVEKKNSENDEVRKLKARVDELQKVASTSAMGTRPTGDMDELARLRKEQADTKVATEKRLASMEEVIFALQKQCEVAEANVEAWKNGALGPGNKRGSVAIGQTRASEARVRPRVTPVVTLCVTERVNPRIKAIVERHQQEVELLEEMRLREVNAQKESEEEVERLKESLARLETAKKRGGTNLKSKMDAAAGVSTRKDVGKGVVSLVVIVSQREAVLREERKKLRNLKKEDVVTICEKEGITYSKLETTKELIAQARADKAVEDSDPSQDLGKVNFVVDITDDGVGGGESDKSEGRDSTTS
ncbi:hypothetical protein CBR_g48728 [Chara braunii]|uniref:Uncharacterized protein n=1 Tax=Chara braunii TaxID=69332 RepID=A0A388K4N8_CHABU|nr:hypothetical protein CBR_g48728 [Chara braunii]|eukprot:GBG64979.1 hypothetical protein CBR_g48728 [Chara braunii]